MGLALLAGGCGSDIPSTEVTTGLTLDCAVFQASVNPIFDANIGGRTCSASGCHDQGGSAGGAFKIYPNAAPNSVQMQANYLAAKGFANMNTTADSKLLLEPLAGAQSIVGSHTGGDIFPDTSDANYLTIYSWIENKVQGPSSCFP
jgi:predicted CxxxxCH...CXXCH cytochrome family protein